MWLGFCFKPRHEANQLHLKPKCLISNGAKRFQSDFDSKAAAASSKSFHQNASEHIFQRKNLPNCKAGQFAPAGWQVYHNSTASQQVITWFYVGPGMLLCYCVLCLQELNKLVCNFSFGKIVKLINYKI